MTIPKYKHIILKIYIMYQIRKCQTYSVTSKTQTATLNPEKFRNLSTPYEGESEEEFVKALQSNKRADYLFCLQQELALYKTYRSQIDNCDESIKKLLEKNIHADVQKKKLIATPKPHKRVNKNAPKNMDLNLLAFQYFGGVDLMAIEGVSHSTVLGLMSEIGPEGFSKFKTAKQFASWLHLSPNTKITGGKVINSHLPKGGKRLKIILRTAANVIGGLKDTHLSNFFKRILYKSDRKTAISATARKLAVIIYNMVTKGQFAESDILEVVKRLGGFVGLNYGGIGLKELLSLIVNRFRGEK
jgi:hypothetical protein